MEVKIDAVFKAFDGQDVKDLNEETGEKKPLTLQTVLVNSIARPDSEASGVDLASRYDLSMRVHKAEDNTVFMSTEEVSLAKTLIPKTYSAPLIVGQAFRFLDPPADEVVEPVKALIFVLFCFITRAGGHDRVSACQD